MSICALCIRAACLLLVTALAACGPPPPFVDTLRTGGELRIAVLGSGTTFYQGANGYTGFEHDLGLDFSRWLGVKARFIIARDYQELTDLVASNKAHVGAGLLPVSKRLPDELRYGPTYAVVRQLVVHRRGQPRPRSTADLSGWRGAAIDGRGARRLLERELPAADGHRWVIHNHLAVEDLLHQVNSREIDYAVVPSFEFEALRRYFPEVRVGIALGVPQAVAWLTRTTPDGSLARAQLSWLRKIRANGQFRIFRDRHFGHVEDFDYVESRTFLKHYNERFPPLRQLFVTSAQETGIDWRLLAAVSYQESHWRADARSPTGVRGLMMLTRATAEQLKVDRLDPGESITGGARYLAQLKRRLPERLIEPDLTWLALAAYNIGLRHLEDARVFAAKAGRNPDRWTDVRDFLPRLANRESARQAKHGFARGYQAVHFVRNVRRYYDILRWLSSESVNGQAPELHRPARLVSPVF